MVFTYTSIPSWANFALAAISDIVKLFLKSRDIFREVFVETPSGWACHPYSRTPDICRQFVK